MSSCLVPTQLLLWLCHLHLLILRSSRLVAVDSAGPDIVLACLRSIYSLGVWGTRNFEGRVASYKIAHKTSGVGGFGWSPEHRVRLVLAIPVPEMPRTFLVWSWWMSWCAGGKEDRCVVVAGTVRFLFCRCCLLVLRAGLIGALWHWYPLFFNSLCISCIFVTRGLIRWRRYCRQFFSLFVGIILEIRA